MIRDLSGLQRQILFCEPHGADDITGKSHCGKDGELPDEHIGAVHDRNDIEEGNDGGVVEIVQAVQSDDRRNDGAAEQSQHGGNQREDAQPAADRHGAPAPVEPAGREEAEPGERKQHKKCAHVEQDQLPVGQLDVLGYDRQIGRAHV